MRVRAESPSQYMYQYSSEKVCTVRTLNSRRSYNSGESDDCSSSGSSYRSQFLHPRYVSDYPTYSYDQSCETIGEEKNEVDQQEEEEYLVLDEESVTPAKNFGQILCGQCGVGSDEEETPSTPKEWISFMTDKVENLVLGAPESSASSKRRSQKSLQKREM